MILNIPWYELQYFIAVALVIGYVMWKWAFRTLPPRNDGSSGSAADKAAGRHL